MTRIKYKAFIGLLPDGRIEMYVDPPNLSLEDGKVFAVGLRGFINIISKSLEENLEELQSSLGSAKK